MGAAPRRAHTFPAGLAPGNLRPARSSEGAVDADPLIRLLAERDQAGMDARELAAASDHPGPEVEKAVIAARAELDREIDAVLATRRPFGNAGSPSGAPE